MNNTNNYNQTNDFHSHDFAGDNFQKSDADADELFAEWNDDRKQAAPQPLKTWVSSYPTHTNDLIDWSVSAPILEYADSLPANPAGEARTIEIGQQVLREMRAQYLTQAAPIADLFATAKTQGLKPAALAIRIGIDSTLLNKLQQRLLDAATIPDILIDRLSNALAIPFSAVQTYLRQTPKLAAGASYKSDGVPQTGQQEDFAAAVRASTLDEAQKEEWLSA